MTFTKNDIYEEVVNDVIKNKNVAITFSPLTGTAVAWNVTNLQGITTTFSATNYLYNGNDILFDEKRPATGNRFIRNVSQEIIQGSS